MATPNKIGTYVCRPGDLHIARYSTEVSAARVLRDYPSAKAVAAAPMFGHTGSRSCGGGITPCTKLIDDPLNVDFPGVFPDSGVSIGVSGGAATAKRGSAATGTVVVQGFPSLVWDGQNVGSQAAEASLAGLGLRHDGNLIYVLTSRAKMRDLAAVMISKGVVAAGYMDAGSSAALYVRSVGWRGIDRGSVGPTLPGWLLFGAEPESGGVPTSIKGAAIVGGILATILGGYALSRVL